MSLIDEDFNHPPSLVPTADVDSDVRLSQKAEVAVLRIWMDDVAKG